MTIQDRTRLTGLLNIVNYQKHQLTWLVFLLA